MAYEIEAFTEQYEDLPLTKFPVQEDSFERMSDVTGSILALVQEYNALYDNGELTAAKTLLEASPTLKACLFNADKYNQLRDGLIAMQRYQLNQLDILYQNVAANAIGINDNPEPDTMSVVAYSAEKVESMLKTKDVVLTALDWSSSVPYTQVVKMEGIRGTDSPVIDCAAEVTSKAQKKALQKNWNLVDDIITSDGFITAYCYFEKPTIDLPLIIKGV